MNLSDWAIRHRIPPAAMAELQGLLMAPTLTAPVPGLPQHLEASVQQEILLAASRKGIRLWRNNVGACIDENDRHIRYGLANTSQAMNRKIKSSDLIGITPYVVQPADVGKTLGIFTSIEVKRSGWKYAGTPREVAQLAWINLVQALGGIARFATRPEDV